MSDHAALADLARRAARAAGELLRAWSEDARRQVIAGLATTKSSATDLATEADRQSERLVRGMILAERPEDAILGEEEGASVGGSGLTWIVDPLDGTTNFVYGFPAWAVSIAVADAEGVVTGVVHDPLRGETFEATRGAGASRNGVHLSARTAPPLREALVATGFGYSPERRRHQAALLPKLVPEVRDIRRAGSAALDLCWLAAGRLDAYYEAGLKPWDFAAGLLVASEAGFAHRFIEGLADVPTLVVARRGLLEPLSRLLAEAAEAAR
jgi:myo-inositol-1(or 4)-monophosphatase